MHQEHNIPWNSLSSNFYFRRDNPRFTPRRTGLFSRGLPTQGQTLNHFARAVKKTIVAFSETERKKYETSFDTPTYGALFSDTLRDRYPEYLNEKNQRIEYWIERAKRYDPSRPSYSTGDGDLADVVKILINENQMKPLLMLSHHPQVPVSRLMHLSWGHHFGFVRVMESALLAYVLLNLYAAANLLQRGEYLESSEYSAMICTSTWNMDFPAQQLPHRAFLNRLPKDPKTNMPELHHNFANLRAYLKTNFALLYRYDMLLREFGEEPQWESEIAGLGFAKTEYVEPEEGRIYCTYRFV